MVSLPTESQVLIVGAGPTGMACALTLIGHGLQVTLVDAFQDNRNGSRSVVIHPRTLEVLKTVGLADPLMQVGKRSSGVALYGATSKIIDIDVGQLRGETEFPFVTLIPQDEVERILREKLVELGVHIFRPHSVVGMKEAPSGAGLEVAFDDGSVINTHYVIGADGSRSTMRHLANIDFKDPATGLDYDGEMPPSSTFQFVLADVYLNDPVPTPIPRDQISIHLNKFFLFCPLRSRETSETNGPSFWRIVIATPSGGPSPPRNADIAWLQKTLNDRCPWEIQPHIASVLTSSRYRVRAAVANTFFKKLGAGNVLLVGDAAHVHSPAGGQGLNLGLCDAVALGNAIHEHVCAADAGTHVDTALSDYAASRRKIALRVVGMTTGLTNFVNAAGWKSIVRNLVIWIAGKTPFLRRAAAWWISGLVNRDA